jgi:hypothetical protein
VLYIERDEENRKKFIAEIEAINPTDLVYIDESGIDASLQRNYARAKRGKQVISEVCGKKSTRTSMIAAWLQQTKELIAPYVFIVLFCLYNYPFYGKLQRQSTIKHTAILSHLVVILLYFR